MLGKICRQRFFRRLYEISAIKPPLLTVTVACLMHFMVPTRAPLATEAGIMLPSPAAYKELSPLNRCHFKSHKFNIQCNIIVIPLQLFHLMRSEWQFENFNSDIRRVVANVEPGGSFHGNVCFSVRKLDNEKLFQL